MGVGGRLVNGLGVKRFSSIMVQVLKREDISGVTLYQINNEKRRMRPFKNRWSQHVNSCLSPASGFYRLQSPVQPQHQQTTQWWGNVQFEQQIRDWRSRRVTKHLKHTTNPGVRRLLADGPTNCTTAAPKYCFAFETSTYSDVTEEKQKEVVYNSPDIPPQAV